MTEAGETISQEFFCSGVSSIAGERKHVLFLDLDGHTLDQTIKLAYEMIDKYYLSDCYIVCSSQNNHHLICLDKFDFGRVLSILKRHAHGQWVKYRSESRDFVLRLSRKGNKSKPRLMCIIESPHEIRKKSNAHRILINRIYRLDIPKNHMFDDTTKLKVHFYRTRMVEND